MDARYKGGDCINRLLVTCVSVSKSICSYLDRKVLFMYVYLCIGCGGLLSAKRGAITSPNYSENDLNMHYPPNMDCYWTIHRPYDRIALQFTRFMLQATASDFVRINEGPFLNSDITLYNRYGKGIPWLVKDWVDRWAWIHFKSDIRYGERGFKLLYSPYEPRS